MIRWLSGTIVGIHMSRGCEEAAAHLAQFVLVSSIMFQVGMTLGESRRSLDQRILFIPSEAALNSSTDIQHKLAAEDAAKIGSETLALWARDCAINEIEQRLRKHGLICHRDKINDRSVVICSLTDLIPPDVAEISTSEIK